MSTIGLFTGIETFNWQKNDFQALIDFCHAHSINQVVLKVYEIAQGDWYQKLGGSMNVKKMLNDAKLDVLGYGFFYGNDVNKESDAILGYLSTGWEKFCLDMESDWDGTQNEHKAQILSQRLANHPGDLYVSTWANPGSHGWGSNIANLDAHVHTWMPMAYDDELVKMMYSQWPRVSGNIQPTFHLPSSDLTTSPVMAQPYQNFTLWEYGNAVANPGALDQFVSVWKAANHTPSIREVRAQDIWQSSLVKPPTGSGIYNVWLAAQEEGINLGFPLTNEVSTISGNDNKIVIQFFSSGYYAEFDNSVTLNKCTFRDIKGNIVYEG